MRTWPALIVAPLLALADQSVAYALVSWACATQNGALLNFVHLAFLLGVAATALPAFRAHRIAVGVVGADASPGAERLRMTSLAGLMLAAFCALTIVAMWMAHGALSPCFG